MPTGSGTNRVFGILAHGMAFFITRTHPLHYDQMNARTVLVATAFLVFVLGTMGAPTIAFAQYLGHSNVVTSEERLEEVLCLPSGPPGGVCPQPHLFQQEITLYCGCRVQPLDVMSELAPYMIASVAFGGAFFVTWRRLGKSIAKN